jgi:hypothetical protein
MFFVASALEKRKGFLSPQPLLAFRKTNFFHEANASPFVF